MDKSEGRSFFSKTFSTVSDKVAKWYHTGNVKLSISSLKRARSEKVQILGNKVFELISQGKSVTDDRIQEECTAIIELDEQIRLATEDLNKIQAEGKLNGEAEISSTTKKVRKTTTRTTKARKPTAAAANKTEKAEKPAKKTRAKKATTVADKPKKQRAKKTVPAVKPENKPAVRVENKPAVQTDTEKKAEISETDV